MIYDIKAPPKLADRSLFFDTGIWLAIYGPDYRRHKRAYSDFYREALNQGAIIYINDYVLSEFHNRYLKVDYALQFKDDDYSNNFKSRREKGELNLILEGLRDTCLDILDECSSTLSFTSFDQARECIVECVKGELDYTDAVIVQHCKRHNLTLVTADGDFAGAEIDIITANQKLLRSV